jgi:UDP-N-acetylmuramate--alanine ligase
MKIVRQEIKRTVHFIGIGGIGTSALARWFLSQKWGVSGSDLSSSQITAKLRKEGIRVFIGHKAQNLPKEAKLVVFSAAIQPDNPELVKARQKGIPCQTYAQTLGDLTKKYKTIAIAGAHGKGTSTALLSLVLIKSGFDPTVIIGTNLKEFGNKNFRKGRGPHLLIEADEYQRHFLHHSPIAALITNIDKEHLDFFKNLNDIKNTFLKFIGNIQPSGILVVNKDDKNLYSLKNKIQKIAEKNQLKVYWYSICPRKSALSLRLSAMMKIPGDHNISNALGVYTLAKVLGTKNKDIFLALSRYRGAWRRMEHRGELKTKNLKLKTKIYDDYAHHPTEIKATLSGFRKKYPDKKIICVFQPHQAKRLKALFREFTTAFDLADILVLLDIYKVPGRDTSTRLSASKVSQNVNSAKLARATEKRLNALKPLKNRKKSASKGRISLKRVIYLPLSPRVINGLKLTLRDLLFDQRKSAIIVMMGAGDIYKMTDKLIK